MISCLACLSIHGRGHPSRSVPFSRSFPQTRCYTWKAMATRERGRAARIPLSENARVVLDRRYLAKDESGRPAETPEQLFARVAHNIAQAESLYKAGSVDNSVALWEERFVSLMQRLDFLPNSPTLMNAGRDIQQL